MGEMECDWYFTFGWGQRHQNCYTVIQGTHESARQEMNRRYGNQWSMQYDSAEAAGVEKYNLKEIK
jgi:hypothetical protein